MFAPLNTKTEYSFLDSVVKVDDYLETAHRLGYQTVGICDVGNLHAAFRFVRKAQKFNLQPIISIELNLNGGVYQLLFLLLLKILKVIKTYFGFRRFITMDAVNFLIFKIIYQESP